MKKVLGRTILKTAPNRRWLKCFLLITLLFPTLPLYAQDQPDLNQVLNAYTQQSTWQSYTSYITSDLQAALSLALDPNSTQYAFLESHSYDFRSTYIPHLRATDGDYTSTHTFIEWSDLEQTSNATTQAEFAITALDSQIYLSGQQEFTDNLTESSIPTIFDNFTLFSDNLTSTQNHNIRRIADYNTFPTLDNIQSLLENATAITDLGLQSPPNAESDTLAQTYQLDINPTNGITTFNLDIDYLLNNPNLSPTFNRDAFYDQLANTATLSLTVYLNPETDELISQQITLSADIQLAATNAATENSDFHLAIIYQYSETFSTFNLPAEIELPILTE